MTDDMRDGGGAAPKSHALATPLPMLGHAASGQTTREQPTGDQMTDEQQRNATRERTRRVLRESGVAEILQTLNRQALQGRGWFEEYDSGVIFKWGGAFTRRHIWVDVAGDTLRFRLNAHRRCAGGVPVCDGEYHTFTSETWRIPGAVLHEVDRNYKKPVAETSED